MVEFDVQPVHEVIEATLQASVAVGELMDSPSPRLSWWLRSKLPREARRIRLRKEYIYQQISQSLEKYSAQGDPKNLEWARSAVDLMVRRERLTAEKEGRLPDYGSPELRDEVSYYTNRQIRSRISCQGQPAVDVSD